MPKLHHISHAALLLLVLLPAAVSGAASLGPGGGGALFSAGISPHDPDLLYMSTDMSGVFRSADFGRHWSMLDFRRLQGGHNSRVRFTADPDLLYTVHVTDDLDYGRPVKSSNGGVSWTPLDADPTDGEVWFLDADPDATERILIADYATLYFSTDGGASFSPVYTGSDLLIGGVFWAGANIFIGTQEGLLVSSDGGSSFMRDSSGIPAGERIVSLTGARDATGVRLFAATAQHAWPGISAGDLLWDFRHIYRRDWGRGDWRRLSAGLTEGDAPYLLAMAGNDPDTLYAAGGNRDSGLPVVYKSSDAGQSWTSVFKTQRNANIDTGWCGEGGDVDWTWAEYAMSFAVSRTNANRALITDFGFVHVTDDGGENWRQAYVDPAYQHAAGTTTPAGRAYSGVGVEQTSSWWLHWVDSDRLLAAYTDIRGLLSKDQGRTWTLGSALGLPHNSSYHFVEQAGRIYGATSSVHDLYQSTYLQDARIDGGTGAVVVSADGGGSWSILHDFGHPVVWLAAPVKDPNTLYASVVHSGDGGIYVTHDLGNSTSASWSRLAAPPRTQGHPFNIHLLDDGTLVATYSGRRNAAGTFTESSGVFVSSDGGQSWQDRSDSGMRRWTKDLSIDPHDLTQSTWYVGVFSHWGSDPNEVGGVYRTTDRGGSWSRISDLYRVESALVHPLWSDHMFVSTETQGLWQTTNLNSAEPLFQPLDGYPFRHPTRVFINPHRPGQVWVTSFGGGLHILPNWWRPPVDTPWQWQLDGGAIDLGASAAMYDIDLFEVPAETVRAIHARGARAMCYFSAGSWEQWRPDAARFPADVLGKDYTGWPGERWLDIRRIDLLAPLLRARLDLCRDKGFDGVEPDNIDAYSNDTGFPLTAADQLAYNIWLAEEAHARGLSIGLKNDPGQAVDLLPYFDWALTEDCFAQGWCDLMSVFITEGKPVFAAEYTDTGIGAEDFCPQAGEFGFQAILKHRNLGAWRQACPLGD